jgi:hypothetical protein
MANEIRRKRIIDGKTYNTETATQLGDWDGAELPLVEALYQTRHGAFFRRLRAFPGSKWHKH